MIDTHYIGWVSPARTVDVEKGRLRFFAKVIGETNPIYTDEAAARAAGYRSLLIPPTFLSCLQLEVAGSTAILEMLHVPIARVLHGEQAFTYHQPVCAGDQITFQTTIRDIYAKKGGALEFIVQETTARNQEDVLVGELRSVIVVRN